MSSRSTSTSSSCKRQPMEIEQRYKITRRVTLTGAAVNCGLACLQITFGLLGKSQALLADGFHTLSDLSTDFIVLYASRRASKAADEDHPYGHGRIETLASMLLGAYSCDGRGRYRHTRRGKYLQPLTNQSRGNHHRIRLPGHRRQGEFVPLHPARRARHTFQHARSQRLASPFGRVVVDRRGHRHLGATAWCCAHGCGGGDRSGRHDFVDGLSPRPQGIVRVDRYRSRFRTG